MVTVLFVLAVLAALIFPVIGAIIADEKGYPLWLGAGTCFFGGILGILVMIALPRRPSPPTTV